MKKLPLILSILLLTTGLKSQTVIESDSLNGYLFEMINNYRAENGLNRLVIDTGLINASHHHSKHLMYMEEKALKTSQHTEFSTDKTPGQESIAYMTARANHYSDKVGDFVAENVFVSDYNTHFAVNHFYVNGDSTYRDGNVEFIESINLEKPDYRALAKYIISAWKISPGHNAALLEKQGYKAGLHVYFYKTGSGTYMSSATYLVTDDSYERAVQRMLELSK